jgi:hypothetical protein
VRTPDQPAICILCAPLPASRDFSLAVTIDSNRPSPTISWYGSLHQLGAWPHSEQPSAILIDPATASSRRELRGVLRAARQAVPQLRAAVIEREMGVPQPDLLVEEGIAVVLTSRFSVAGRPRRPAPAGWPCRSVQWGLWELLRYNPTAKSWRAKFFQQSAIPRLSPGALAAIDAATPTGSFESRRLKSLLARVKKQVASGRLIVPKLEELPGLVCGGSSSQAPSSILRAA